MSQTLSGKIAAITGAASGIGRATAALLLQAGARVVLVDRDEAALRAVCQAHGAQAVPLALDLLDAAQCDDLLARLLALVPHIDILHANAGTYLGGDLLDADCASIDRMLQLNVNAVIKNVRCVAEHMVQRKSGDIIVTSSLAAHHAVTWEPVYCPSKWAVDAFVQTVRRQLRTHGIRVGSVSPGPVSSALLADWPEENLRKAKESGGIIEPEVVADAILYMLARPRTVTIRDMVIIPSQFDL